MKTAWPRALATSFLVALPLACATVAEKPPAPPAETAAPNTLTPAEKEAGWRLLFDGKTSDGWRGHGRAAFPTDSPWAVEDGTLHRRAAGKRSCDLVTSDEFDSFELRWEWKIAPGGNSGLKYLVDETMAKKPDDGVGFEYQMLDDDRHPDAKMGKEGNRTAGSLYDLIPPARGKVLHPPGEWNESRLVVDGNHIEHWLNGGRLLSFERGSPEFRKLVAESKFKDIPRFGEVARGHILLQDHGNEVTVRNIKIRAAKGPRTAAR
jgi:hypothetical protein